MGQCIVGYSYHQFAVSGPDAFYFIQIAVNNGIFFPGLQGVNWSHTLNDELVFVVKTIYHAVGSGNKKFVIALLEDGVISAVAFRHGYAVIIIEFGGFYDLSFGGSMTEKFHFRKFHRKVRPGAGGFEADKSANNRFVLAFKRVFHQSGFGAAIFVAQDPCRNKVFVVNARKDGDLRKVVGGCRVGRNLDFVNGELAPQIEGDERVVAELPVMDVFLFVAVGQGGAVFAAGGFGAVMNIFHNFKLFGAGGFRQELKVGKFHKSAFFRHIGERRDPHGMCFAECHGIAPLGSKAVFIQRNHYFGPLFTAAGSKIAVHLAGLAFQKNHHAFAGDVVPYIKLNSGVFAEIHRRGEFTDRPLIFAGGRSFDTDSIFAVRTLDRTDFGC